MQIDKCQLINETYVWPTSTFKVSTICIETDPCYHPVEINGKKCEMSGLPIHFYCKDHNLEIPDHFLRYSDEYYKDIAQYYKSNAHELFE
jgi:hypothetical protein